MANGQVRAGFRWLTLREPADAAARAPDLVELVRPRLPSGREVVVHDLGCGTGSMARWLAPRLDGAQRWVLWDRDAELLHHAAADPPTSDRDQVSVETRQGDVTRLDPELLSAAALVTASALLDMMTAEELDRLVATCVAVGCPALITLSVTGRVELSPAEPLDERVGEAFNDHQRRRLAGSALLGPDAVRVAADAFRERGWQVDVRESPWRLGPDRAALAAAWFAGWLGPGCEQRPELGADAASYRRRRLDQAAAGELSVTVGHLDLLARPGVLGGR
jgi:trans-aconitate methyltransferase